MFSTAIVAIAALFATGTSAAPLGIDVGAGVGLGLNVGSVNSCLFRDPLTRLVVNSGLVLDLNANVCLPVSACAQVEVLPLGLLSLPVCKKVKTCPATLSLNDDGLCVCVEGSIFANTSKTSCITKAACTSSNTNIVSGKGVSAICKPKPCADGLTLNADGLCVCADGLVFSGPEKSACIAVDACDTKLNVLQGGVCLPKICLSTQILDLATGLCIDRSLCNPLRNTLTGGVCKAKVCASGQKLNLSTGVCDLVSCAAGLLFNPARTKCISTSACNLFLNNVVDGACMPKPKCSSSGLFRLVDGICACGEGLSLNVLGLCVAVNIGL